MSLTSTQRNKIASWTNVKFSWAKDYVFGIEKDYKWLAKTTKVFLFLNGDSDAQVLDADGINKFSCKEYSSSKIFPNENKNEMFDFVVFNPPCSVKGYI